MSNIVDIIFLLIIILFALIGAGKGLWQYLWELLATAISLGAAWYYYRQNQQMLASLLVFIVVLLCLSLLKFILGIRRKSPLKKISLFNHLGGAVIGITWGIFISSIFVLTLDVLPIKEVFNLDIKKPLKKSRFYKIVEQAVPIKRIALLENLSYVTELGQDEQAKLKIREDAQFQQLMQNENFKAVIEDEELTQRLQDKDLAALLSNKKILNLLNDGQFIEKLLQLDFKKVLEKE